MCQFKSVSSKNYWENISPLAGTIKRVIQFQAKPVKALKSKYVMNDSHSCGCRIMRSSLENMFLHKIQSSKSAQLPRTSGQKSHFNTPAPITRHPLSSLFHSFRELTVVIQLCWHCWRDQLSFRVHKCRSWLTARLFFFFFPPKVFDSCLYK